MKTKTKHPAAISVEGAHALDDLAARDLGKRDLILSLAALQPSAAAPQYALAPLTPHAAEAVRAMLLQNVADLRQAQAQGELDFQDFDDAAQQTEYEVEYLPLAQAPDVARYLAGLRALAAIPDYDRHDQQFTRHLRSYVAVLQAPDLADDPIYFVFEHAPRQVLKQRGFILVLQDGKYAALETSGLEFEATADCVIWGQHILVLRKRGFDRIFRDKARVQREGEAALAQLSALDIIANFDEFAADVRRHPQKLAKMRNMDLKGYLAAAHIKDFAKYERIIKDYGVPVTIVTLHGQQRLKHNPQEKWALLKLMDDDYLESALTGNRYEVNSKRRRG